MRPADETERIAGPGETVPTVREIATLLRRAESDGARAASVAIRAPDVPLPALLLLPDTDPCVLWNPPGGPAIAGLGAALSFSRRGTGSLSAARELVARLPPPGEIAALASGGAAPVPPRAFAGGAFDAAAPGGWPASEAVLPRFLYRRDERGASLAAIRLSGEHLDPGALARKLHALAARLAHLPLGELDRPAAAPSPAAEDRDGWHRAARAALREIAEGGARKIVLARPRHVALAPGPAAARLAARLDATRGAGTLVAFAAGGRTMVAASPETLVRREGALVEADALAGTRAPGSEAFFGEKERREQRAVVEEIRATLARLDVALAADEPPCASRVTGAVHLRTVVRGRETRPLGVVALADALHPTPAVAGVPRSRALAWIARHEPEPRGWYAGPLGWFDAAGNGRFVVLLRGAAVEGREAVAWAGAGLVRGSDPSAEFDETTLKLAPVLAALGAGP